MLHEIENTQKEIRTIEDQILEQMMKIEESEQQLGEAKQKLTTQESLLSKKRDELESSGSKIQGDIDQLNNERDQLEKQIQDELLQQYKKIALARNQIAITEAKDQTCQACHVRLRPQLFNEIKTSQKIITCESCNRILYYIAS